MVLLQGLPLLILLLLPQVVTDLTLALPLEHLLLVTDQLLDMDLPLLLQLTTLDTLKSLERLSLREEPEESMDLLETSELSMITTQ